METSANTPKKCFPIVTVDDFHNIEHCTYHDSTEEWHELEQFWGDPRHKLQEFDSQTQQLSSSLERHLLFDECLQKPEDEDTVIKDSKDDSCFLSDSASVIYGEDINDIPTQYTVNGFKPNELIVIGTYIDKRVIPGFKYRIRKNLTEKYLFDGKALRLDRIGLGYGKRLTFESPSLNNNTNYFWSDSNAAGFGFTLCVINKGDVFGIFDPVRHQYCGRVIITQVKGPQIIKSVVFGENGRVEKSVDVEFTCNVVFADNTNKQTLAVQDSFACGTVLIVKKNHFSPAEVEGIQLSDFVVKGYELKPDN